MTRHIYLDRAEGGVFTVRVLSGLRGDRTYAFAEHAQAAAFAERKMGRAGVLLDTTTMTQAQLAEHRAHEAHTAALAQEARAMTVQCTLCGEGWPRVIWTSQLDLEHRLNDWIAASNPVSGGGDALPGCRAVFGRAGCQISAHLHPPCKEIPMLANTPVCNETITADLGAAFERHVAAYLGNRQFALEYPEAKWLNVMRNRAAGLADLKLRELTDAMLHLSADPD